MHRRLLLIPAFIAVVPAAPTAAKEDQIKPGLSEGGGAHNEHSETEFYSSPHAASGLVESHESNVLHSVLAERQYVPPLWPYTMMPFDRWSGDSCGFPLTFDVNGVAEAPFTSDCLKAKDMFRDFLLYYTHDIRITNVSGTCVLVWHAPSESEETDFSVWGNKIKPAFDQLFDACKTGAVKNIISNYAYHRVEAIDDPEHSDYGVVSAYRTGDPEDGTEVTC